ncbi:MAG: MFS transporter [Actinomycetota bacterium]
MWESHEALDAYSLVHMASAAGDALVAVALADSVFFSLPVGQAKIKVALYLGLTMAPLAVAGPLLVPLLDRGGFRRVISFASAAGRAAVAIYAAPHFDSLLLFPSAFVLLVLSKVHGITKNGLTVAYVSDRAGLVDTNARFGRLGVIAGLLVLGPGVGLLKLGGAQAVLGLAAVVFVVGALLNLRLPHPPTPPSAPTEVDRRGRIPDLALPAIGNAGARGALGFLILLLAFGLLRSHQPKYWFGVLAAAIAAGGFVGDVVAPRLSHRIREATVVVGALLAGGAGALLAFTEFRLEFVVLFAALAGAAAEFGKLAFQSLMQREAPSGAQGRVFVRYEVVFQLAWVAGAFLPALLPIPFRPGVLVLALFYLALGSWYVVHPLLRHREVEGTA